MKIGLAQMDMVWENKEKNFAKSLKFLNAARVCGVNLLLFPEMSMTGFSMNAAGIGEETENSRTLDFFREQAAKSQMHLGVGYVKKEGDAFYNCYALVSPQGELLFEYAKIHPFSYGREAGVYRGGERLGACEIQGFCVAPLICYDLRFPEVFQILSEKASLILVPANWPLSRQEHFELLLRARALENQCFVAGVNRVGEGDGIRYGGGSLVADPYGNILVQAKGEEQLLCADLDRSLVEQYRRDFPVKKDRRDNLYMVLSKEGVQTVPPKSQERA